MTATETKQVRRSLSTGSLELNFQQEQQEQEQHRQRNEHERDHIHYFSTLLAGVGSGALSSFVCAPLDLVRTRMQVWGDIQQEQKAKQAQQRQRPKFGTIDSSSSSSNRTRTSTKPVTPAEAFRVILKKEGPKGMFRGLGATLVTVPLFWGVYFPLYDETKHFLQTSRLPQECFGIDLAYYHPGVVHCMSAIFTGAIADLICNPFFVVRTRLQTQALYELTTTTTTAGATTVCAATNGGRVSMIQMASQLHSQNGISVFWRGMTANLIGLSHCAVQFPAYEFLKGYLRERRRDNNMNSSNNSDTNNSNNTSNNSRHDEPLYENTVKELLLASGLAKMSASLLSYPHEVLRSRMVDSRSSTPPTLSGTAKHIFRNEGVLGFYNGLGVTLVRVIPNCCVTFLSYEMILKHSKEYFGNRNRSSSDR